MAWKQMSPKPFLMSCMVYEPGIGPLGSAMRGEAMQPRCRLSGASQS